MGEQHRHVLPLEGNGRALRVVLVVAARRSSLTLVTMAVKARSRSAILRSVCSRSVFNRDLAGPASVTCVAYHLS
jgi:hypothetical protein